MSHHKFTYNSKVRELKLVKDWQLHGEIYNFAGSDTPLNKVLRGIRPRGTTFKNEYFCEFEKESENILGCEFGDYMGSIRGKNQRSKISCYCPFNELISVCYWRLPLMKIYSGHRYARMLKQNVDYPTVYRFRPRKRNGSVLFAENKRKCAVSVFCLQPTNRSGCFPLFPFSIYT
jgi:hypothetical protein